MTAVPSGTTTSATMFTDPRFVNAVTEPYDFSLLAASPAIDAGLNEPAITVDYYGVARTDGRTDISASEYVGGPFLHTALPTMTPSSGTLDGPTTITIATRTPGARI